MTRLPVVPVQTITNRPKRKQKVSYQHFFETKPARRRVLEASFPPPPTKPIHGGRSLSRAAASLFGPCSRCGGAARRHLDQEGVFSGSRTRSGSCPTSQECPETWQASRNASRGCVAFLLSFYYRSPFCLCPCSALLLFRRVPSAVILRVLLVSCVGFHW